MKSRLIIWVWNHTPNCAEMSRLSSRRLDEALPLEMRLRMWLHCLICVWCKRYKQQVAFLHRAAPKLSVHLQNSVRRNLSEAGKARILNSLRKAAGSP